MLNGAKIMLIGVAAAVTFVALSVYYLQFGGGYTAVKAVAVTCIAVTVILAASGAYYRGFKENWAQWIGLWGAVFAGIAQIGHIVSGGHVSSAEMLLYMSVASYAIGTAAKAVSHSRKARAAAAGRAH